MEKLREQIIIAKAFTIKKWVTKDFVIFNERREFTYGTVDLLQLITWRCMEVATKAGEGDDSFHSHHSVNFVYLSM